jgi:hypothetical protein
MKSLSILQWASLLAVAPLVAAKGAHAEGPDPAEFKNKDILHWAGWIWVSIIGVFIIYQVTFHLIRYVRTVACLSNDTQRYFAIPSLTFGRFKKYLLDAPLFRTRHHREFKLSTAVNVGTLPNRLQMAFIVGYFGTNVAFCVMSIDWSGTFKEVAGDFRNRTGVLSVLNMIPLFLLAGRNNPLITFCGISFDTFNLIHRWFGRIVVLEALAHTFAWMANKVHEAGWAVVGETIGTRPLLLSGLIGTVSFTFLLLHSPSAVRHAFYETFLTMHILVAALAIGGVWVHVRLLDDPTYLHMIWAVVALWALERLSRIILIVVRNFGAGGTKAEVEALPGDCVKVTIRMARPWTFRPGQHAYIYMPSIGLWTNHPFSLAWSDEDDNLSEEKGLPMDSQDILDMKKTTMSMIIRRRTGFTERLFKKADLSANGRFTTTAFLEGPYGMFELSMPQITACFCS